MAATNFEKPCSGVTISCLPDEVLGKILSFLPTKQAVSTSLLSKKWTFMYRLADCLDFDDSLHLHAEEGEHVFPESFKNCVDRTLALQCDYSIKKFSLKCHIGAHSDCQRACVGRWISNVVGRGVVELDLQIIDWGLHFMPPQLFASKTLVKLTLGTALNLGKLPSDVLLPSLKFLFIDTLFCPVLEELSVRHEDYIGTPFCISNHSIKKLSVHYDAESEIDFMSGLSFDTPSLVFLDYFDYALNEYTPINLEALVEARLDIRYPKKSTRPDIYRTLHLSPDSVDCVCLVICRCIIHGLLLPVFNNLVNLSFGSKSTKQGRGWKLLPKLLELSPKLETLIIQGLNGYTGDVFMPLNHLKVLHILGYGGTSQELKHLRSFLGKTECLVNVKEAVVDNDIIILKTKKELMMLLDTSVSPKCQIKVT
ncbi:hypothetical protein ARALYDRAFT_324460 [Arabidopsis lyrata subsp. lyrata]|uniref:F-box domain-containing protein n=1 Tax=Arabidopsis lyrata subsp. lyrata TaxID=81972 RepID=D7LWK3_ARALL|nr:hypothetical protein ARALYDRAFT_324460 [Arabidopsis lyrata subsp. lyrata]